MAIKVTKPGVLSKIIVLSGTCIQCGCEVECGQGDTQFMSVGLTEDGLNEDVRYVKCPTENCGHEIVLTLIEERSV